MQDFVDVKKKRYVQSLVFSRLQSGERNLVGLGGRNLPKYLKLLRDFGIVFAEIWESDPEVHELQLRQKKEGKLCIPCKLILGDIYNAEVREGWIYDMDFCKCITSILPHVAKFRNGIFTFSRRGGKITISDCIQKYMAAVGCTEYECEKSICYDSMSTCTIHSNRGTYTAMLYSNDIPGTDRDGNQMMVIYPNSLK